MFEMYISYPACLLLLYLVALSGWNLRLTSIRPTNMRVANAWNFTSIYVTYVLIAPLRNQLLTKSWIGEMIPLKKVLFERLIVAHLVKTFTLFYFGGALYQAIIRPISDLITSKWLAKNELEKVGYFFHNFFFNLEDNFLIYCTFESIMDNIKTPKDVCKFTGC
jgi:hypothetical protein